MNLDPDSQIVSDNNDEVSEYLDLINEFIKKNFKTNSTGELGPVVEEDDVSPPFLQMEEEKVPEVPPVQEFVIEEAPDEDRRVIQPRKMKKKQKKMLLIE